MATIYDVAKRAGVSPKTVSRVLNGDAPVSQKTREAVSAAMTALGYVPSHAARSMKSHRSGLIGLITGAISNADEVAAPAGLPELFIVQGVQHVIESSRKTLLISDTGGRLDRVPALVRTFQEHRVEGILYVSDFHKPLDVSLDCQGIRKVLVNCFDDAGTPAVIPDDEGGQYALTKSVVAAGHKRIAYLTLAPGMEATRLRMKGFCKALAEAGISHDPALVMATDLYGSPGEHQLIWDTLDKFFTLDEPPTAICCGNDRLAMAVYGILRKRGIAVPEQVSVVGYDDHRLISETLYPALTTAELPYSAMGARAARLLLDLLADPLAREPDAPILVSGQVRQRSSLVAPNLDQNNVISLKGRTEI
ncbi:MAG: LacI family DNA-binding transcriptional regulator [Roseibium sp.]|uniref:LacI family DNA-binding transcriptional regulator n=1 Tax=Roseibium sp. TaxID=1936156 RepID=UPI001B209139|nr:LacI family DNA-binding transcriptional regulator [Roseibium sp.]MBO6893200.1 LacI family DNA-binding transcriptional regulator [Roseibium sp.]MBO6932726.1 LacI family DNA-binding transcriptional regulator [Roseibium sp.]